MKHPFSRLFGFGEKDVTDFEEEKDVKEEILHIPVDEIVPNPFQPRTVFSEDKIDELAQTIRTHGIIQPIVVRKTDERYEIIAGERRWRAVKKTWMDGNSGYSKKL